MTYNARALWYRSQQYIEIKEEKSPEPNSHQVRVTALFSGISRGTEALVYRGQVPPSQWDRMRAPMQTGNFPFPVKYGYSLVGRRSDTGAICFVLHPHQDVCTVSRDQVVDVPEGVPPMRAVLASNMETALNAVWDAQILPAQRVAVVGAGAVGSLIAFLCKQIPETRVHLIDCQPSRADIATAFGCTFSEVPPEPSEFDSVFHCSGTGDGLAAALKCARTEGPIIELSWYGTQAVPVYLGEDFHARRLQLISSQVGHVAKPMRHRVTHRERLETALKLLNNSLLDRLIAEPIRFEDAPRDLPAVFSNAQSPLCQPLAYT